MRRLPTALVAAAALALAPLTGVPSAQAGTAYVPPEERAAQLIAQMTLDEKISQVHTTGTGAGGISRLVPGIPRLGIPDFLITNGPAGVGTGAVSKQPNATALPAPVAVAAGFDTDLARKYGVLEGRETADVGHSLIEAPDVNMVRVYRNGRAFENYGEDPYLAGQLGVANIKGIQSQGVLAEVKHYTANDQETKRTTIQEQIDDRTLHEIHLPAFEDAVKKGRVASVMCAYPAVNGQFMCENKHLLTDVLRGQWGFDGFVQSDASATHTAVGAADAGQDLELRDNGPYDDELKQAVLDGQVSVAQLDTMIERRLAIEIRAGLFGHPRTITPLDAAAGGAVARSVAEQSAVLLKNAGSALLPLDAKKLHSIAVVGPYAQTVHPGGGGSSHVNPLYTVSPIDAITKRAGSAVTVRSSDGSDVAAAAQLAGSSDVAVVIVGDVEKEGTDRSSLSLTGNQDDLVKSVVAANPHTIVVLNSGAPVLMPWVDSVPAILEAWYPGEEDGNALASLLFGDVNPSGKLPVTFPRTKDQTPVSSPERYPGVNGIVTYSEKLEVGYRWYDAENQDPLFPFGYGLSYTKFEFSHLTASPPSGNGHVTVGVDVRNTGSRTGAEVAQVYVTDPTSAAEPPKQLKGFAKVSLRPGQTKHVTLTLDQRAFSIWDSAAQRWTTVGGRYTVSVGDSSRNLPLSAPVMASQH
ncbi:MAG: bglX [Actinoallomurus sp.]|jgi:beta-glucosidase|nr:bglX [Actinoallomurus sp.]